MSIDKSLVIKTQLLRRRSVFSRTERLQVLSKDGRWKEGESVFGLPKVRNLVARRKGKKKEEKAPAPTAAPAEQATQAEKKPAGGEKPVKPGKEATSK